MNTDLDHRNTQRGIFDPGGMSLKTASTPWGLKWRASGWYITMVVALGVTTDILTYSIIVPVLPYRLQSLGYTSISSLVSWLLFAYSLGIFIFTFPVAYFFHRYPYRRGPLVIGVVGLELALVLFMVAQPFWVMVVSRFLQGACSTVIWCVGFALICENVEEKNVGRQIGWALSGVSVGSTIAPPIGGALYSTLGWLAPFVFCLIVCAVDLVLRCLVVERKHLVKLGIDRQGRPLKKRDSGVAPSSRDTSQAASTQKESPARPIVERRLSSAYPPESIAAPTRLVGVPENANQLVVQPKELSPLGVLAALARSGRGLNGFLITFVFGLVLGALDPTLTLRVEEVWGKDSAFVGIIYLIASAPTFAAMPVIGHFADKFGAEWIMAPSFLAVIPFVGLLIPAWNLAAFVVFFTATNLVLSCALAPSGLEMAMASKNIEGLSEIHQFASMNVAFAVSSAIGAIAGGQMYDTLTSGWAAVCYFCMASCALGIVPSAMFAGRRPLWWRFTGRVGFQASHLDNDPRHRPLEGGDA